MSYDYRMLNPNVKALPVNSYSATLTVTPKDGGSEVEWYGRFYRGDTGNEPPDDLNDEAWAEGHDHVLPGRPRWTSRRRSKGKS